jgi:hypothetical protein
MKTLKIKTEWILETFPMSVYAEGNGTLTISTFCFSDARWIELALDSMNILYESYEMNDDETGRVEMGWEFEIQSIKEDCPKLYKEWSKNDLLNSAYRNKN